jgi:hypothetical protein
VARNWRVDTLRGVFLVLMTLGHFPNPLARFTEYTFGYASAPDGFVFLSGLVSAWVYLRLAEKRGSAAMRSKVLRRSGQIYLTHLVLFTMGILFALSSGAQGFRTFHPFRAFALGSLLLYQGGFDKILPMYCVFLAFTPLVLKQFTKGRAWVVGVVSASLWIAAQFGLGSNTPRIPWLDLGTFNVCAWQAYFIVGQYLGFRGLRTGASALPKSRALLAICAVIAAVLMLDRHLFALAGTKPLLGFSGHPDHNPARFLDAACLGYMLSWIPGSLDRRLMQSRAADFCNRLGQHSLQVFAFSMLITRFEAHVTSAFPVVVQLLLTLLTVLSLYLPARLHQLYRQRGAKAAPPQPLRLESLPAGLQPGELPVLVGSLVAPSLVSKAEAEFESK